MCERNCENIVVSEVNGVFECVGVMRAIAQTELFQLFKTRIEQSIDQESNICVSVCDYRNNIHVDTGSILLRGMEIDETEVILEWNDGYVMMRPDADKHIKFQYDDTYESFRFICDGIEYDIYSVEPNKMV